MTQGGLFEPTPLPHLLLQFLRAVSEGIVAYTLDRSDLQRAATRVITRELLAGVVLRPLMMWMTPYYANKVGTPCVVCDGGMCGR